ncbi:hypothetical protein EG68_00889 [Paragonimus skrjabini miyazakii]|uniref:SCP domain-containing protein n=1 Tax=Paragonimus skrjabini miyazakii TaxID=59628 RepID=A0A8S9Z2V9_9TREM|nr:hypothetical protein EG68_00889 [Paragonimus skrjabini miyazakii]
MPSLFLVVLTCITLTALRDCLVDAMSWNEGRRENRLTTSELELLNMHNAYRELVRNGKISGQPGANSLPDMTWDGRLALEAQEWSNTCKMEHDGSTKDGENLAFDTDRNGDAVTDWFMEHKDFKFGPLPNRFDRMVLHYTQVSLSDNVTGGICSR